MSPKPTPEKDDLPVGLDLNAIVEEVETRQDEVEPFVLTGVGPDNVAVTFQNPQDLPWQDTQQIAEAFERNDLTAVFNILILDDDELNAWARAAVPGPVAGEVLNRWMKHHGWDLRRGQRMNRADRRRKK